MATASEEVHAAAQSLGIDLEALEANNVDPAMAEVLGTLILHTARSKGILDASEVQMYVLPGGRAPEKKTEGAVGYDAYARAVVHPRHKFDPENPYMRLTLADFETEPTDDHLRSRMVEDPDNPNRYGIKVPVGEFVLVGLGFCTALPNNHLYWLSPRSGLSSRGITLSNAPGTVDADYRGEAGALLENRGIQNKFIQQGYDEPDGLDRYFTEDGSFVLTDELRVCQCIFQRVVEVDLQMVDSHEDLSITERSAGGFGSTGMRE